jgi:hypothetical protein
VLNSREEEAGHEVLGAALANLRGRGLDWGCIVVLLREFFFGELLFYCSVARLQWRDGVSRPHGGTVQGTRERLKRWKEG